MPIQGDLFEIRALQKIIVITANDKKIKMFNVTTKQADMYPRHLLHVLILVVTTKQEKNKRLHQPPYNKEGIN